MPRTHALRGITSGNVDTGKEEIRFALSIARGEPISFVGKFGAVAQAAAALGRMLAELRAQIQAKRDGTMAPIAAEQIQACHIQKDPWQDVILVQLINPQGIPYSFAMTSAAASDIAARLKIESEKPTRTGSA